MLSKEIGLSMSQLATRCQGVPSSHTTALLAARSSKVYQ